MESFSLTYTELLTPGETYLDKCEHSTDQKTGENVEMILQIDFHLDQVILGIGFPLHRVIDGLFRFLFGSLKADHSGSSTSPQSYSIFSLLFL